MTEITVSTVDHVSAIHIETPYGAPGNVQGTVQIILVPPVAGPLAGEGSVPHTAVATHTAVRQIDDLPADVQAAITLLQSLVPTWAAEDKTPAPPPQVDPEPEE
jgi:hypothetical protein